MKPNIAMSNKLCLSENGGNFNREDAPEYIPEVYWLPRMCPIIYAEIGKSIRHNHMIWTVFDPKDRSRRIVMAHAVPSFCLVLNAPVQLDKYHFFGLNHPISKP